MADIPDNRIGNSNKITEIVFGEGGEKRRKIQAPDKGNSVSSIETGDSVGNSIQDEITRIRVEVKAKRQPKEVADLWFENGKPLKHNPIGKKPPTLGNNFGSRAKYRIVQEERYARGSIDVNHSFDEEGNGDWHLTSYTVTRYHGGKPFFKFVNNLGAGGWQRAIYLWPEARRIRQRPFRSNQRSVKMEKIAKAEQPLERGRSKEELDAFAREFDPAKWEYTVPVRSLMEKYFGNRKNLTILELGPSFTTWVPKTFLQEKSNRYIGLDLGETALRKQRELLHLNAPEMSGRSYQVAGNLYRLPCASNSIDVIVNSTAFPLFEHQGDTGDFKASLDEITRVLKKGGEFFTTGGIEMTHPAGLSYLFKKFKLIDAVGGKGDWLILQKK